MGCIKFPLAPVRGSGPWGRDSQCRDHQGDYRTTNHDDNNEVDNHGGNASDDRFTGRKLGDFAYAIDIPHQKQG